MGTTKPVDAPRTHGIYRVPPTKAEAEIRGRRATPARPGVTYVPLWSGAKAQFFMMGDLDRQPRLVDAMPEEAKLVVGDLNPNGIVPSGVCAFINFALEIQNKHMPKQKRKRL